MATKKTRLRLKTMVKTVKEACNTPVEPVSRFIVAILKMPLKFLMIFLPSNLCMAGDKMKYIYPIMSKVINMVVLLFPTTLLAAYFKLDLTVTFGYIGLIIGSVENGFHISYNTLYKPHMIKFVPH